MPKLSSSIAPPSNSVLENALRKSVQRLFEKGNLNDLTVKRIRQGVEEKLGLQKDFFKNDPTWKGKSKAIIQSEAVRNRFEERIPDKHALI